MKTGMSINKNIPYLSLYFLDDTGEIKGTVWREAVGQWKHRLQLNEVYDVSNFSAVAADFRFSRLQPGIVQFSFVKGTQVFPPYKIELKYVVV